MNVAEETNQHIIKLQKSLTLVIRAGLNLGGTRNFYALLPRFGYLICFPFLRTQFIIMLSVVCLFSFFLLLLVYLLITLALSGVNCDPGYSITVLLTYFQ